MQLVNAAATRQRTDLLWDSQDLLGSGATFSGAIRLVAGYGGINFLISSNLSFRLRIQEGPTSSGPWTETDRIASALNDAGDAQIICQRIVPCGSYMRIFVDNLGGATQTSFVVHGLGIASGDTSTAIVTAGGVFDEDTDDDSIASGQTTLLSIVENYQFDGSVWRRFQSRGAVAAQAYTLQRTLVDSVLRGDDGTTYSAVAVRNFDTTADITATLVGITVNARTAFFDLGSSDWERWFGRLTTDWDGTGMQVLPGVHAVASGRDTTGVAVYRMVEARDAVTDADFAAALIGLLVNNRPSFNDVGSANYRLQTGDVGAAISGRVVAGNVQAPYVAGLVVGYDSTGATVLRPVEARDFTANTDVVSSLIGLLVNARNSIFDLDTVADHSIWYGTSAASVSGADTERRIGALVYQARESAFSASRRGRRFYITHQTPTTSITAQAAFVATTPTFMLRLAAATVRAILRSIRVVITSATTAPVDIVFAIDTADRLSAGGTTVTPQNANEESATASGITSFLTNPTATAAGAGTRYLVNDRLASGNAASILISFKDGVLLSTTASALLYLFDSAATTAPTCYFVWEIEEVA